MHFVTSCVVASQSTSPPPSFCQMDLKSILNVGKHVNITTGGVTVPSGVFSIGDAVTIYNDSASDQTVTQGSSVTLRSAGTANTGNRTLAQRGICTVLCVGSNEFVITGAGLS